MSMAYRLTEYMKQALKEGIKEQPAFKAMIHLRRKLMELGMPHHLASDVATRVKFEVNENILSEEGLVMLDTFAEVVYQTYVALIGEVGASPSAQEMMRNMANNLGVQLQ